MASPFLQSPPILEMASRLLFNSLLGGPCNYPKQAGACLGTPMTARQIAQAQKAKQFERDGKITGAPKKLGFLGWSHAFAISRLKKARKAFFNNLLISCSRSQP
jgi:hypothetical protein